MSIPPSLPSAQDSETRKAQTDFAKSVYKFDPNYLPKVVLHESPLPKEENFDFDYQFEKTEHILQLGTNLAAVKARELFDHFDELQDFEDYFQTIPSPSSLKNYQFDTEFARQRVAGANPIWIKKIVDKIPDNFKFTDEIWQKVTGEKTSYKDRLKEGKLFLCDYSTLDSLSLGKFENGFKYASAPIALFYWQSSGYAKDQGVPMGSLIPIAIQLNQTLAGDEKIFTPLDGLGWKVAKLFVQSADANVHEAYAHLGRTHLPMEPIIIATHRNFAKEHPLFQLLKPHFTFNLAIDEVGKRQLINKGGFMDQLLAGTLEASLGLVAKAVDECRFDDSMIHKDLKLRGVFETESLPDYPYRHDALLIWDSIYSFVTSYIDLYYTTDLLLKGDSELQAWVSEIRTLGKVKGFATLDRKEVQLETKSLLADVITHIIFTCTAQHSAVNFAQYDFMANVANMPFALYQAAPKKPEEITELKQIMKFLPPNKQATQQVIIMYLLTAWRYNRLGHYEDSDFSDTRVEALIKNFRSSLMEAELKIDDRNKRRVVPYPYLKPSLILNSINI